VTQAIHSDEIYGNTKLPTDFLNFGLWLKSPCGGQLKAADSHVKQAAKISKPLIKTRRMYQFFGQNS